MVLLGTVAAVAPPLDVITGTASDAAQLRAIVAEPALRELGDRARAELMVRVGDVLAAEADRHLGPLSAAGVDPSQPQRLREAAARVARAVPSTRDIRGAA